METGLGLALRLKIQSILTDWGPIYPSLNLLVTDPVLYLTQDGGQTFELNYSKHNEPSSQYDRGVIQTVLCVYNHICFFYVSVPCLNPFSANLNVVLTLRTMMSCTVFLVKNKMHTEVLPSYLSYRKQP